MPHITVYDSVPQRWPEDAEYILAYVDGAYTADNYHAARRLRPKATVIGCTTTGRPGIKVADCERGDLTPHHAALWASHELCKGRSPVVYGGRETCGLVRLHLRTMRSDVNAVGFWLADWDGRDDISGGYVAHQYNASADYDVSVADWDHVKPYTA